EQFFARKGTIGLDGIGVSLSRANIGDIKHFTIGSADDAVGLLQVGGNWFGGAGFAVEKVNVLPGLLGLWVALPIIAGVKGVGEINISVGANPEIVRSVEQLAAEITQ